MLKSVLVTGARGQLGSSIQALATNYPSLQFTFVDIEELDLSCDASIEGYFQTHLFDIIINCAAYTAVDKAESEPDLADAVNHLAVKQLAKISKEKEMLLIHISTDYVFNGKSFRPYIESDSTDPQCVYGASKLKGERAFQALNPAGMIIRTSWVYSEYGHNFVKTMLKLGSERDSLGVIFDQIGSPTYAGDLAKTILEIINVPELSRLSQKDKVFHYSNEGVCSWYDFSNSIFEASHISCDVKPIETKDYPTPAQRPHYSLMNKSKIKQQFDITIPYWKDSLKICIKKLQEQK